MDMSLTSMIPDGLYDLASHTSAYHYPPGPTPAPGTLWVGREDRTYQDLDAHLRELRHPGMGPELRRVPNLEDNNKGSRIPGSPEWTGEEEDLRESEQSNHENSQKQSQVAATLKWLSENYERAEGVCLPRCVLYTHYLDFCKKMKFTPAGAATFGKIIRQKFPKLTTRRLGTRGQSKYHYYGIGIKESSIYYHSVYSGKGLTRFSGIKIKTEGSNRKYSLSSKTGTLLPEFPDADNLILPESIEREKMHTFIMMYRTHCQRILDTVISANFEEIQNFLLHFWQGMPEHLVELLKADVLPDIIALCDSILYKVLIDVLIPSTIQDLPDSLSSEIKIFVKRLPVWLDTSMEDIPESLREIKLEVAKGFIQSIRRQISFVHLAQTARSVLLNHDSVNQMIEDMADIDFSDICWQAGFLTPDIASKHKDTIHDFFDEFQSLLSKQAPVEAYTEWLDNIIDKCVLQPSQDGVKFQEVAAEFLLHWAAFGALIMRDFTLQSASSFGSFHLLHLLFDEYVLLVMETQQEQIRETLLQKNVQKRMKNAEEIKMQPKVRTHTNKSQISPKNRKRKHIDDVYDSNDESEPGHPSDENRPHPPDSYPSHNGTAFSRPVPSAAREANYFHEDSMRVPPGSLPLSPLKHYPTLNGSAYDRPYLPQFGLNAYPDYVSTSNSFGAARMTSYSDAHASSFSSVPFSGNLSPANATYWSDTRSHPGFPDYSSYPYSKLSTSYDGYSKTPFLRTGSYHQDTLNRSAFDTSRSFYRGSHDNFQVPGSLSVNTYGGNFMDIAQTGSQYGRQDSVLYQDEFYPGNMPSSFTSLGKSYIATPFR